MSDPTDLRGQEQDAAEQAEVSKLEALQQSDDIKWLLGSEAGRRIAWRLLEQTGVHRNPFNHSGSITAFNCGQMNIGQWFVGEIMANLPNAYTQMLTEHQPK